MTAEEKAIELLKLYFPLTYNSLFAKKAAIICVEQIIEVAWWSSPNEMPDPYRKSQKEYWQEVLEYLKNS